MDAGSFVLKSRYDGSKTPVKLEEVTPGWLRGKLDAATLERALRLQQESGEKLGALLVTLGVVAQRDVAEALALTVDFFKRHLAAGA